MYLGRETNSRLESEDFMPQEGSRARFAELGSVVTGITWQTCTRDILACLVFIHDRFLSRHEVQFPTVLWKEE